MRLVHLSDLHHQLDWHRHPLARSGWRGLLGRFELHGLGRLARFADAQRRIEQILDDLHALGPDHVVLTGDLTSLGDEDELGLMEELLRPFLRDDRLTVIPGNHDRYTDTPAARRFERLFGTRSDLPEYATAGGYPFVRLVGADLALIGLDSTRVGALSQYFVGRLGRPQLAALRSLLDDPRLSGRTLLVLSHHGPLGPAGAFHWRQSGLLDAAELLEVLHGRPTVLLHGHSHDRYWHRAAAHRPHIFAGGSSTEQGGEGYWLIDVDAHDELDAQHLRPGRLLVDPK